VRQLLTERYRGGLAGVLSCYDRIIVTGTLPGACYAKGMTGFLSARQTRIFVTTASRCSTRRAAGRCRPLSMRGVALADLTLREVSKRFGDVEAVPDLSLSVADGEFVVTGAGKTTTLHVIAGLERPAGRQPTSSATPKVPARASAARCRTAAPSAP